MPLRIAIAAVTLLVTAGASAQIYKWIDEDGVVHYSDQAHPGAEIVLLPDSNRADPLNTPRTVTGTSRNSETEERDQQQSGQFTYESLDISSPQSEETLWNIGGTLEVSLNLQPALRANDRVRIYFDGEPQMVDALQFELTEVWRGEHNLQAEVLDSTGALMIRSEPLRFYVQQTSVNN